VYRSIYFSCIIQTSPVVQMHQKIGDRVRALVVVWMFWVGVIGSEWL